MSDFLRECREMYEANRQADDTQRREAEADLRFFAPGGQWEPEERQQREADKRPVMEFNRLPQYVRQVVNDARIRTPNVKVLPVDSKSDPKLADVLVGLIRNIEAQSRAEVAYITALQHAVVCGMGHFRITTKYARDDAFDLDLAVEPIASPLAVTWDARAREMLRTDAMHCFVVERIPQRVFNEEFPDAAASDWDSLTKQYPGWYDGDFVNVAQYWWKEAYTRRLALGRDGTTIDLDKAEEEEPELLAKLRADGFIVRERKATSYRVKHVLLAGHDELSDPEEWVGSSIPIIPVVGEEINVGDHSVRYGLVRHARGPQKLYNIHRNALAEGIGMAPKAKWLATPEQIVKYKEIWEAANTSNYPWLPYETDPRAPGPPQRIAPDLPSQALLSDIALSAQDIEATVGIYSPNLGQPSNERSGKAIVARQREGDVGTYAYLDNLRLAVEQAGRVLIECIPAVYDTTRAVRVLNEDGSTEFLTLNAPMIGGRTFDLSAGKYDVQASAGLSYSTRREEARESVMAFMQAVPAQAQLVSDLFAQNQDWPGADEIAKRFRKQLVAQGIAEPEEGDPPPAPPPPDPNMVLAQAEMVKAQAAAERAQIEAQTKAAEVMNDRIKLLIEVAKLKQQGVEIAIDGVAKAATVQNAQMNTLIKARDADLRAARPAPANGAFDPRPAG